MKKTVTTHILDMTRGRPAQGIPVTLSLEKREGKWKVLCKEITDEDGRIAFPLSTNEFLEGHYRLDFYLEDFFENLNLDSFIRDVSIPFAVKNPEEHYHIPLLLSPNGYSTYRGS